MRKTKIIICTFLILIILFPLGGCWDYRGLDELSIVTGIAVDKKPEDEAYKLTFEIVDLVEPLKEKGPKRKLIESEGKTMFEAVRNAKRRINNKLYFGHAQIIIFCQEIARNGDLKNIIDFFIRDAEIRETMSVIISQEKTARDILATEGLGQTLVSSELYEILEEDKKFTPSTLHVELYQVFNILNSKEAKGQELALPAVHIVLNDDKPVNEANGMAIFKDNKLVGFLPPDESKYYLFVMDKVEGGVIAMPATEDRPNITLEILDNYTDVTFDYKDEKLKFKVKTKTVVFLDEYMKPYEAIDENKLASLKESAKKELEKRIGDVVKKLQNEYGSDVFGFGNMVYKNKLKLWKELSDNWNEHFKSLDVEVEVKLDIINTSSIK